MKINAGEIRVGMLLEFKNDLWQVLKTQHVKPGKGGAFAQVEMKSVGKNTKLNERFRSSENVEKATLEEINFNYLYSDENNYFFMDPKTFEQIEIKKNVIGEKGKLLTENLEVSVSFYNDSAITIDSIRFMMCSIDSSLEEVLPNLYFSPDSEFNENESIYSEFISFSEDGLLYLDNPEIDTKYDTNSIYSHTELLWNVDTLIDIFSDTLDTDPLNSFVLFPQNTNSTLIELFSEEATDGEKDPQLIIYYTRTTYISDDSIVVDTNKSKIYSNGDLSIIDPSGVIYDTGQVGLCNGTGMRSIINIPKVEDSIPNGSLIRTANLMIPYDTNRTNISMAKLQNITIDLLTSDSINIDSMLFSNTTFEADPFSGIGYPYRVENDADTTIINNGIYRVSMKNIIQSKVLGDNISSSLKLVSNEKNNPFEHVWLSNMENDIIKIEILYVKN